MAGSALAGWPRSLLAAEAPGLDPIAELARDLESDPDGIDDDSTAAVLLGGLAMVGATGVGGAFMGNPYPRPKGMCY